MGLSRVASTRQALRRARSVPSSRSRKSCSEFLATGGNAFLSSELRRAISRAPTKGFFQLITDSATPVNGSFGITADAAGHDLRWLLRAVDLTSGETRPLWVCSPDVGISAATLMDTTGQRVFADMSPVGGSMLNIPCTVTSALADGTLGLIDGAQLVGDALGVD